MPLDRVTRHAMLTPQQIAHYREYGFLVVENVLSQAEIAALVAKTEEITELSSDVTKNDTVYDLEESHSPEHPRVHRIKRPHQISPLFWETVSSPKIVEIVEQLIGPDIRLKSSKINNKYAGFGAAIEWHQDWAFVPSTNDDQLTVGIMLDAMTEENGPLMVLPQSHRGPIYDHHRDGRFCAAMDAVTSGADFSRATKLTGPAGSITLHHVRAVHGSDLNRSGKDRRLLLYDLAAADSWPLSGGYAAFKSLEDFDDRMIAGRPTIDPRMVAVPVRIPLPDPVDPDSIYTAQRNVGNRYFGVYEDEKLAP